MTRLLITGGSGYLGQHLAPAAANSHETIYTYFRRDEPALGSGFWLDVRDSQAVEHLVVGFRPEVIIHLAGSNRTDDMDAVIVQGAENIVNAADSINARLIHFSTDVIFDGTAGPYSETDPANPIHAYGRSKKAAEQIISQHENHVIIRTSLIYGLQLMDHSTQWIISSLKAHKPTTLFSDQIRNPVWVDTLCQAAIELAHNEFRGAIHVAGSQEMNRAQFGLALLDWWGWDQRAGLTVGPSDDRWPKDCRLSIDLANHVLSTKLYGFDEVLAAAGSHVED